MALVVVVVSGGVLRLWALSRSTFVPDESYTAIAIHRRLLDVVGHIGATDPHPPLSYLLLWPIGQVTGGEFGLRLPSSLLALGSLVLMAGWQRARRLEGLAATAFFAFLPFQLTITRQARMYGLMVFLGVAAAWAGFRWLQAPTRRLVALLAVIGMAAAFSHAMGFIVLVGLVCLPGLRRDREAFELRAATAGAGLVFAALWGPTMVHHLHDSLYQPTTLGQLTTTVNELVAAVPGNRLLVLSLMMIGGVCLWRNDPLMARVWTSLFVVPVAVVAIIGLRIPMVIPKTLMVVSWGPPVALAAVVITAGRRWLPFGAILLGAIVLVTVPYIGISLSSERAGTEATQHLVDALRADVAPGDVVAVHGWSDVVSWYFGGRPGHQYQPVSLGRDGVTAWRFGAAPPTGRVWLVDPLFAAPAVRIDLPRCADRRTIDGNYLVRCVWLVP